MAPVLTTEQVSQVVNNTVLVLLARRDLVSEWHENLVDLLKQAQQAQLDDETFFVAAVLTLLESPDDTLPTGTIYDPAWEMLVSGLRTGQLPASEPDTERLTLEQLLGTIADTVVAILTEQREYQETVLVELREMRSAAADAAIPELVRWLDDTLTLIESGSPHDLGQNHEGLYASFWEAITHRLNGNQTP